MTEPLRIAWLTTGRGPGSYGALEYVLRAIDDGLPVEIAVAFINRERGEYEATDRLIAMLDKHEIPVETLSSVRFRKERGGARSKPGEALPAWRNEFDEAVAARLRIYDIQLGVLFGYMLITTSPLHNAFTLINDHPALPDGPVGTYQQVIEELIRTRATDSGCLMHLVTEDLDRGPVVAWCRFGISDVPRPPDDADIQQSEAFAEVRRRGVAREQPFLVETLRAVAEDRLDIPPTKPLDLTLEVEAAITPE
jgi:folate-dependent phosphoribosylglycinamide formyltransferase PurN